MKLRFPYREAPPCGRGASPRVCTSKTKEMKIMTNNTAIFVKRILLLKYMVNDDFLSVVGSITVDGELQL
jgi:hypothetical protein